MITLHTGGGKLIWVSEMLSALRKMGGKALAYKDVPICRMMSLLDSDVIRRETLLSSIGRQGHEMAVKDTVGEKTQEVLHIGTSGTEVSWGNLF